MIAAKTDLANGIDWNRISCRDIHHLNLLVRQISPYSIDAVFKTVIAGGQMRQGRCLSLAISYEDFGAVHVFNNPLHQLGRAWCPGHDTGT